jgi:hypothetical protein
MALASSENDRVIAERVIERLKACMASKEVSGV